MAGLRPSVFFRFATNIVVDPTTSQNNRTPIALSLLNNGYIPFGVKPSRQSFNQALFELGLWTEAFEAFSDQVKPKTQVMIRPRGITIITATKLKFDTTRIGVALKKFAIIDDLQYIPESGSLVEKEQASAWSIGFGGGLRANAAPVINQHVHIFMIAKDDGTFDFASDTSVAGNNVTTNVAILAADFTYIRHICTLSYVDIGGPDHWRPFFYGSNDMILFTQETTDFLQNFNLASGTGFVTQTLDDTGGNILPDELTTMRVVLENQESDYMEIRSNTGFPIVEEPGFRFGDFNGTTALTYYQMETEMEQIDSTFRMSDNGSDTAKLGVRVLGYKNPAIERD